VAEILVGYARCSTTSQDVRAQLSAGRHSTPHLGQDGTEVASTCARGWPVAAATASINCPRFISSSTAVIGVLAVIVACRKTGSVYDMPGRAVLYHREASRCRWAPLEFAKPIPGQFRLSITTPLPGV